MTPIAQTPEPPYYAAIFTTVQSDDAEGYVDMAKRMFALAAEQPGYLGFEIAGSSPLGIGISYWTDEDSIRSWKANAEHQEAQDLGRTKWYDQYQLRIAKVERDYGFPA
ncbi:UNVERIFIED_CONTAM: hypothetical protein GTU68_042978 [Idotea baltica]|nr:hypothetical protein [Idotea baltica]